ncbi:hypothetical protein BDW66DRAFT_145253 [Aspergillus desertorum]
MLILAQLLTMNVVVFIIDFVVVIVEYAGFYAVQVMFKPVAYSIKLKLEYAVLGRLVQIAQCGSSARPGPLRRFLLLQLVTTGFTEFTCLRMRYTNQRGRCRREEAYRG